jgi:hypothetical protein
VGHIFIFNFILSFLTNFYIGFHIGYTNLHSHQQCMSLHLCNHLVLRLSFFMYLFFMLAILTWVICKSSFFCIYLIAKDAEHFSYMYELYSSFEMDMFRSLAHLLTGFFCSLMLNFWDFFHIFWVLILCRMNDFDINIFILSKGCLLNLLVVSLVLQSTLIWCVSTHQLLLFP